ncbi:IS3 family transposase [Candidatus Mycoplasma pogonae]
MAKQLKLNEWLEAFEIYEKSDLSLQTFWEWYCSKFNKKNSKNTKRLFREKYFRFKISNDMEILKSKSGKAPKKNKGVGRKPKPLTDAELWKIYNELEDWEKFNFFKRYKQITDEKSKNDKNKEAKSLDVKQVTKVKFFQLSKSGIYKYEQKFNENKSKEDPLDKIIIEAFNKNKGIYGREKLSFYIKKEYKIFINPRTLGRKMKKLGLFCKVRQKTKAREIKNTNVKISNLVQRDYNDVLNRNIVATDVTYISAPKDVKGNHVYLSAAIHHKTKKIISWKLSILNNADFILQHHNEIDFNNQSWVLHSDHGSQYSTEGFAEMAKRKNAVLSMSRIGNSLDNREIEYFFSCIKSEWLNFINISTITFQDLENEISRYIDWYNNERIQSILGWKTPQESWGAYIN